MSKGHKTYVSAVFSCEFYSVTFPSFVQAV